MSTARAAEVLGQILADFKELNKGPNDSVPVKTIWVRSTERGITKGQDVTDALNLGVTQGWFTYAEGGIANMGTITLTEYGYEKSRA